jgi:beta-xylosidase
MVVSFRAMGSSYSAPTSPTDLPTLGHSEAIEATNRAVNDVGDPFVLAVPAGVDGNPEPSYVLYWTTDWSANVPTAVSTDLVHWRRVPDSLPTLPSWARVLSPPAGWSAPRGVSTATMGPSVQKTAGGWMLYYATEDAANSLQCIGAAFSTSPIGPFTDSSVTPLVCQDALGGDIDPNVVVSPTGPHHLLWKSNGAGASVGIWEQALSADGRSLTGSPVRLIGADQPWENHNVEGPAMVNDTKGGWWLFYSGGDWQSTAYDTGVAWCATVSGPCHKPATKPLLASIPTAVSPGGFDTFVDHHGKLWASYSVFPRLPANVQAAYESPRVLELAPIVSH